MGHDILCAVYADHRERFGVACLQRNEGHLECAHYRGDYGALDVSIVPL